MEEKFFRVLLGGLMASSVPRGRPLEPRILPSGWRTVNQDCAHLHVENSDEPSPGISFSHRTIGQRSVQQLTLVPRSQVPSEIRERKTKYGSEGSFSI